MTPACALSRWGQFFYQFSYQFSWMRVSRCLSSRRFHNDVAVLDVNRKCFGHIGTLGQRLAILNHHRISADPDAAGIEIGLAVAHVELPAVPGAAQQFPDPRV